MSARETHVTEWGLYMLATRPTRLNGLDVDLDHFERAVDRLAPGANENRRGALVSLAFDEHYQGRDLTIWQGLLDAGHQVIADPYSPWAGRMDVMSIELGEAATITLTGAHRLADMDRPRGGRCNDADQQSRYPGDKFFEFLESMQNAQLVWGFPTVLTPPPGYVSNDSSGVGYSNRNTGPSRDVSLNGYSQSAGSTGRDRSSGTRGYS